MTQLLIALSGMMVMAGLLTIAWGTVPRAVPLSDLQNRSATPKHQRITDTQEPNASGQSFAVKLQQGAGPPMLGLLERIDGVERHRSDLRICQLTPTQFAFQKLASTTVGIAIPVSLAAVFAATGIRVGPWIGLGAVLLGALIGFVVPDLVLRSQAAEARRDFKDAFAAYLEAVRLLIAGGMDVQSALTIAARQGKGPAFQELRHVIDRSATRAVPIYVELEALGEDADLPEVKLVASGLDLSTRQGNSPADALISRAETITERQRYDDRMHAEAATAKMPIPTTILVVGFLALLLIPALQTLAGSQ